MHRSKHHLYPIGTYENKLPSKNQAVEPREMTPWTRELVALRVASSVLSTNIRQLTTTHRGSHTCSHMHVCAHTYKHIRMHTPSTQPCSHVHINKHNKPFKKFIKIKLVLKTKLCSNHELKPWCVVLSESCHSTVFFSAGCDSPLS